MLTLFFCIISVTIEFEVLPPLCGVIKSDTGTPGAVKIVVQDLLPDSTYNIGLWVYGGASSISQVWDKEESRWKGGYPYFSFVADEEGKISEWFILRIYKPYDVGYSYYISCKVKKAGDELASLKIYTPQFEILDSTNCGWLGGFIYQDQSLTQPCENTPIFAISETGDTVGVYLSENNNVDENTYSYPGYIMLAVKSTSIDSIFGIDSLGNRIQMFTELAPPWQINPCETTFVSTNLFSISIDSVWFNKTTPQENELFKIFVKLQNHGPGTAKSTLKIYEDTDWDDSADVILDTQKILLPAQTCDTVDFELKFTESGNYKLLSIITDPFGVHTQSNFIKVGSPIGEIVINEILPYTDYYNEWIELYNRKGINFHMNGFFIASSDDTVEIPAFTFGSDSFVILCDESANLVQKYGNIPCQIIKLDWGSNFLSQSDVVTLLTPEKISLDQVSYSQKLGEHRDTTIERISPDINSEDSLNWNLCVDPLGGTPGKVNSIFVPKPVEQIEFTVEPNTFCPEDPSRNVTYIRCEIPFRYSYIRIYIYDRIGRLVRKLADEDASGQIIERIFDGKNDRGEFLPMGIYIVYFEAQDKYSQKKFVRKKTCVLLHK